MFCTSFEPSSTWTSALPVWSVAAAASTLICSVTWPSSSESGSGVTVLIVMAIPVWLSCRKPAA
jgi:hypothetical protein